MRQRPSIATAGCLAACLLTGCGGAGRGPAVASTTALQALKAAGFTGLVLAHNTQIDDRYGEVDEVAQRRTHQEQFADAYLPKVELDHYVSGTVASRGFGPAYVRGVFRGMVAGGHVDLPRHFHFSSSKAFSVRICNVILWSYNAQGDPRLTARLKRAARAIRNACH